MSSSGDSPTRGAGVAWPSPPPAPRLLISSSSAHARLRTHRTNVIRKLEALKTPADLILYAIQRGLIDPDQG